EFSQTNCCTNPLPETACDHGGWPQFDRHGLSFRTTNNAPLSWDEVKSQLGPRDQANPCGFTPFAFTWHWPGGGGHMMVAIGYQTVNGVNYVQVHDPLAVNVGNTRFITYENYVSGVNDEGVTYTHWNDYYDIK